MNKIVTYEEGMDSDKCNAIAGFSYEADYTCGQTGALLNSDGSYLLACSKPYLFPFLPQVQSYYQSTCCGGAENHKDICPDNPNPYEAICTSKDDFLTDTAASYACKGTNADACTAAGGEYNNNDEKCENIDTFTSDKCDEIAGFNYEEEWTCGQMGSFLFFSQNLKYLDCSNPDNLPFISQFQSTCCGGADNHKDICADAQAPHEAFCISEQDYQTNAVAIYACQGTDAQACTDADGEYNEDNGYCDDIDTITPDKCGEIAGFTYVEDATCEEAGNYLSIPENAAELLECSNPWVVNFQIPTFQATCCGGANNIKDICSDAPKITSADICNQCNNNRDEAGVSTECFTTISMLAEGGYGVPEVCRSSENGSAVNVECKAAISSRFDCASPTSPPIASPVTSPVASPVTLPTMPTSASPVTSPDSASVPRGPMHGIAILMCLMLIVHAH